MPTWRQRGELWTVGPTQPKGVVQFLGGSGLGASPQLSYKRLLEAVSRRGWLVQCWSYLPSFDHQLLAVQAWRSFRSQRQSDLPVLRLTSRAYIEVMRAVPLIAVLFFGQLLIPLFLPPGLELNRVLRAVIAFALFAAAYIAEDVRGGLQAIPPTQTEAAAVLGLSPFQSLRLVLLPQALRIALPALTNQAVGLLQNTSLMAILGLVELLGISRSLLANPAFIGRYLEVYVWLAAVYWLACTAMALLARHLEIQLDPLRSS